MHWTTKIPTFLIPVTILFGCLKDDGYAVEPHLTFVSYNVINGADQQVDSAIFSFQFTDGDGDLGSIDTSVFNCFLEYYEKDADTMRHYPEFQRAYRLPVLTPSAKNKSIEGVVNLTLKPAPVFNPFNDSTYQWRAWVKDESGNESNIVSTPITAK